MQRKKWIHPSSVLLFAGTVVVIAMVVTCTRQKDNPAIPEEEEKPIVSMDTVSLETSVDSIATLCASGNRDALKDLMTESARSLYGEALDSLSDDDLKKIAAAIDKKSATMLSPVMAEYELVIDGLTYTIAFTQGESEGSWNIVQF